MRTFVNLVALSVVATLTFASVAMAESSYAPSNSTRDCSGAEEGQPPWIQFYFLPDARGCIAEGSEGSVSGPIVSDLNKVVFDADTGERLGVAKDLDPDLSSGANSVTYQGFCRDFDGVPEEAMTPQSYFEQTANAKEQAILDPDGDGLACAVDTVRPTGTISINVGAARTTSRRVELALRARDPAPASRVSSMRFRNENRSTWSSWKAYDARTSWWLSSGAGTKAVFVQYKDRAGNVSIAYKDTIRYRP